MKTIIKQLLKYYLIKCLICLIASIILTLAIINLFHITDTTIAFFLGIIIGAIGQLIAAMWNL